MSDETDQERTDDAMRFLASDGTLSKKQAAAFVEHLKELMDEEQERWEEASWRERTSYRLAHFRNRLTRWYTGRRLYPFGIRVVKFPPPPPRPKLDFGDRRPRYSWEDDPESEDPNAR